MAIDPGIAVVRRNTEEVQGRGNFDVFEELFAIDFVDHTLSLQPLPPTATVLETLPCASVGLPRFARGDSLANF